jgi:hypothetical protein
MFHLNMKTLSRPTASIKHRQDTRTIRISWFKRDATYLNFKRKADKNGAPLNTKPLSLASSPAKRVVVLWMSGQ